MSLELKNKFPRKLKLIMNIIGGSLAILATVWLINSIIQGKNNSNRFFKESFSTIVVSSNSFQGRSLEFHLKNDLEIYFLPPAGNKIMIGDSIKKLPNTYLYNVYRKNINNKYVYFATYDFKQIY